MSTLGSQDLKRPDALGLTNGSTAQDVPPRLSRSPHPYSHRKESPPLSSETTKPDLIHSPPPTPSPTDSELEKTWIRRQSKSKTEERISPIESGTEADDEALTHLRALPAPPFKPRKGLRGSQEQEPRDASPAYTPQFEQDEWGSTGNENNASTVGDSHDNEIQQKQSPKKRLSSRRAAEIRRRTCEILFLLTLCLTILHDGEARDVFLKWRAGEC